MPEPDLIELFAQPLNQANIRYLITGKARTAKPLALSAREMYRNQAAIKFNN
jgi:hypothetical protein